MMARFEIVYTETSVLLYEVEAENEEEAQEKWYDDVENGRVDFTDMEVVDSEFSIRTLHEW